MLLLSAALITAATSVLADAAHGAPPAVIRGVDPALVSHYLNTPSGSFSCISDPSIKVPFSAINDDYCDCPDGSDEPGTSACSDVVGRVKFWCANEGHIPGWVYASRVNDDSECCDGSDEWDSPTECPNRCAEIGAEHRAKVQAEQKLRKTGSKIRATYIKYAQQERIKLAEKVKSLEKEIHAKEGEVEAARVRLERLENADREQMEKRKQSPIYLSLLTHRSVIGKLRSQKKQLEEEVDELKRILKELSEEYNPNYQDMAVKAAVVGYTEKYGKPVEQGSDASPSPEMTEQDAQDSPVSEQELDELEKVDLDALIMSVDSWGLDTDAEGEADQHEGALYRIDQYIPDALYDSYENLRDSVLTWLIRFGIIGKGVTSALESTVADAPHMVEARKRFNDLSSSLQSAHTDLTNTQAALTRLDTDFGLQGEWKKLENTCIDREQGDFFYTLCFFGKVTQKSNKDGATHHLGTFAKWNAGPDVQPGTEAYYSKQLYNRGLKCWNGPERSVSVDLTCGTTNEITHISEPEKCEYRFQVTTPALCWPDLQWEQQQQAAQEGATQPARVSQPMSSDEEDLFGENEEEQDDDMGVVDDGPRRNGSDALPKGNGENLFSEQEMHSMDKQLPQSDPARPEFSTSQLDDYRIPNSVAKTGTRSRQSSRSPGPISPTHNLAPQSKTAAQLRRMKILPALVYDPLDPPTRQTLSLDPTIVIPHPCATYSLAATPCLSYLLTGNQDGYVRSWDFWASANSGSALSAVQRGVANLGEGVNKAGVARGYWKNEAEVEEVIGGEAGGGGKARDKKPHMGNDSAFSFLESGQANTAVSERKRVKRLEPVHSLAVQSDGLWALCGTESGSINLTTVRHAPGTIVHALQGPEGHTKAVSALCLSSDETKAFSGSWDQTIKQWDLNTGQVLRTFAKHRGQISTVQMRPENVGAGLGNSLAPSLMVGTYGDGDKPLTGMNVDQSEADSISQQNTKEDVEMRDLQQAEDGLENGEGSDYDSLFGDEEGEKEGGGKDERPVNTSGDATNGSAGSKPPPAQTEDSFDFPFDGPVTANSTANSASASLPAPPTALPTNPATNSASRPKTGLPPSKHLALPVLTPAMYRQYSDDIMLATGIDGEVALHDLRVAGDTLVGRLESSEKTPPWCMSACFSSDGQQVIAGRRNASLDVWDIRRMGRSGTKETPNLLRTLKHPATSGYVSCVAAFPDAQHIAVWLWVNATKSGVPFRIVAGHHGGTVSSIYIDPTGKYMITASGSRGWFGDTTKVVLVHERK
ncbi:hypothetical protein QFC19_001502 [Naganishia cerealis]|uniref:Uncharacterized protein n=1 Tax=Naganishia cerealis TaxID=610337 RepID=A0ACC2WGZ4_9TREE|nr:hypothetical protein QFC19_001502 [Naganishia cerealis]